MRWVCILLLVAACGDEPAQEPDARRSAAHAEEPEENEAEPRAEPAPSKEDPPEAGWHPVELPGAYKAWKDKGESEDLRVVLTLDATGHLFIEGPWAVNGTSVEGNRVAGGADITGGADEPRSLNQLGLYLHRVTQVYGKTHLVGDNVRASNLEVLLRVDRRTPWRHVHWVTTTCSEQKVYKLWFAATRLGNVGEKSAGRALKVKAYLPTDRGIKTTVTAPEEHYTAPTHVVFRESGVAYRYGDRETTDPKELYSWIDSDFRYAMGRGIKTDQLSGEIKAAHKAPAGAIITVLTLYLRAGFPDVDLAGTRIPGVEERRQVPFPAPKFNYK